MKPRREPKKKPAARRQERQQAAVVEHAPRAVLEGKTPGQNRYIKAVKDVSVTACLGPAGTGKTYIAASLAAQMVAAHQIQHIILCRPAVEATGERLGFLPGEMEDKMAPWTAPVLEVLREKLGQAKVAKMLAADEIRVVPFAYMRGRTFSNAFVILDEAQNCTVAQLELFTGRLGANVKAVINGDIAQSDIGPNTGLAALVDMMEAGELEDVRIVEMTFDDIVRGAQCAQFVRGWAGYHKRNAA